MLITPVVLDSNCLMQQKKITLTKDTHKFEILKLGFAMFAMVDSVVNRESKESVESEKKNCGESSKIAKFYIVY